MAINQQPVVMLSGVMLLGYALMLGIQPYSVRSPWSRWDEPARRYLEAASRSDTVALRGLSASSEPVQWALDARTAARNELAEWARSARAWTGLRRGDTTDVWYGTLTDDCSFRLTFIREQSPRVIGAHAWCNFGRYWPIDPKLIDISR
jgi:hypothetical protein